MSKRKVDPMAQAIRDLKYLERVVKALEVLCGERERVAMLTARLAKSSLPFNPKTDLSPSTISPDEAAGLQGLRDLGAVVNLVPTRPAPAGFAAITRDWAELPDPSKPPRSATLDTPERQEYEAAKREGRTVPDPFADPFRNATPEQRERMAEQRAAIAAEKKRMGLIPSAHKKLAAVESDQEPEVVVSTEELATGANGSFGAAVSVTATDERLSPEESDG